MLVKKGNHLHLKPSRVYLIGDERPSRTDTEYKSPERPYYKHSTEERTLQEQRELQGSEHAHAARRPFRFTRISNSYTEARFAMATIDIEINVRAEIGIAPSEKGREQALLVGVHVEIEDDQADCAGSTGKISDTLDYTQLRAIVHEVFAERRFDLLEEVTLSIRNRITALEHVRLARVSISKHHPWADVARLTLTR